MKMKAVTTLLPCLSTDSARKRWMMPEGWVVLISESDSDDSLNFTVIVVRAIGPIGVRVTIQSGSTLFTTSASALFGAVNVGLYMYSRIPYLSGMNRNWNWNNFTHLVAWGVDIAGLLRSLISSGKNKDHGVKNGGGLKANGEERSLYILGMITSNLTLNLGDGKKKFEGERFILFFFSIHRLTFT